MLYHNAEVYVPEIDDYINVEIKFRIYAVGEPFSDDVEWEYDESLPQTQKNAVEKHIQDNFHKIMRELERQMKD